jgi:hypothetical protein
MEVLEAVYLKKKKEKSVFTYSGPCSSFSAHWPKPAQLAPALTPRAPRPRPTVAGEGRPVAAGVRLRPAPDVPVAPVPAPRSPKRPAPRSASPLAPFPPSLSSQQRSQLHHRPPLRLAGVGVSCC